MKKLTVNNHNFIEIDIKRYSIYNYFKCSKCDLCVFCPKESSSTNIKDIVTTYGGVYDMEQDKINNITCDYYIIKSIIE